MGIYKRKSIYYIDYTCRGRRIREAVGESKKLAEAVLHKRKTEVIEDKFFNIKKSFLTAVKKSSIINFHFHDLRHTLASHLVMGGVDLNTVRELLGHKTLDMTLRYSHLSPDHKKRAVDVLNKQMDTIWTPEASLEKSKELTVSQLFENKEVTV